eukprot:491597-Pyramimonas_sp.AAC.1
MVHHDTAIIQYNDTRSGDHRLCIAQRSQLIPPHMPATCSRASIGALEMAFGGRGKQAAGHLMNIPPYF